MRIKGHAHIKLLSCIIEVPLLLVQCINALLTICTAIGARTQTSNANHPLGLIFGDYIFTGLSKFLK